MRSFFGSILLILVLAALGATICTIGPPTPT